MGLPRSMVAMLKARPLWEANTGRDDWGNETFAAPVTIAAFVDEATRVFGGDDGQGTQDGQTVDRTSLITDYLGIGLKDRITLPGGQVLHVSEVATTRDQRGDPMFQTITVTSTTRG